MKTRRTINRVRPSIAMACKTMQILKRLYETADSYGVIALEFKTSRQYVGELAGRMKRAGWKMPDRNS